MSNAIKAVFEDTRQKIGKHENIRLWCEANGVELIRDHNLFVGDYTLITDQRVSIDTKSGLDELCMDVCAEKSRFMREIARAKRYGIKLIVLVEDGKYGGLSDVSSWYNPRLNPKHKNHNPHAMTGRQLQKRLIDIHVQWGTDFLFCSKQDTGRVIVELLGNGVGNDKR